MGTRPRGMRTLEEVSARLKGRLSGSKPPLERFAEVFRIDDRMTLRIDGDTLVLACRDRVLRLAYRGMEGSMAGWLKKNGLPKIRRIRWSVE